jgi:mRNA interferase MazF
MIRDYLKWHELKSKIEFKQNSPLFREREVWWCSLGSNLGVETDGKNDLFERPILVLKKFNREMLIGLPMTSKKKEGKYYFPFFLHGKESSVILSQVRSLSSKRLIRRLGKISNKHFSDLEQAFTNVLQRNGSLAGASSA